MKGQQCRFEHSNSNKSDAESGGKGSARRIQLLKKDFLVVILKLEGKSNTIYNSWSIFDILLCNITDSCFPVGKVYYFIIF